MNKPIAYVITFLSTVIFVLVATYLRFDFLFFVIYITALCLLTMLVIEQS